MFVLTGGWGFEEARYAEMARVVDLSFREREVQSLGEGGG